jgi:hypothetical protein
MFVFLLMSLAAKDSFSFGSGSRFANKGWSDATTRLSE